MSLERCPILSIVVADDGARPWQSVRHEQLPVEHARVVEREDVLGMVFHQALCAINLGVSIEPAVWILGPGLPDEWVGIAEVDRPETRPTQRYTPAVDVGAF